MEDAYREIALWLASLSLPEDFADYEPDELPGGTDEYSVPRDLIRLARRATRSDVPQ